MDPSNIAKTIGNCASIAALLEVSAYPKPGNVHRLNDMENTRYEHFLAGSVSLGSAMGKLAERSYSTRDWSSIGLGRCIRDSVDEMFFWQNGGNIHLGVILLFAPLSAAAGVAFHDKEFDVMRLKEYTQQLISKATPRDSIDIYAAIDRAMSPQNLGSAETLDVNDERSIERIRSENITPLKIFELCKERDLICHEWVTGFSTVFEKGYPYLRYKIKSGADIKDATVDTFLNILAEHPDSLIQRKKGKETAQEVSKRAREILQSGGTRTEEGKEMIWRLDEELKKERGLLNPGTTADLTAASLFVLLLSGWRP
ncbi:ATP--dephospho-CoA triphosphoribosyl transferase CitG [Candidatus Bathyarchaeota archaeon]|nr:ATP--dephospho-CoA triphosphoribosyl transferase CitG [Candidatus Bathyarchaeota archaeon]